MDIGQTLDATGSFTGRETECRRMARSSRDRKFSSRRGNQAHGGIRDNRRLNPTARQHAASTFAETTRIPACSHARHHRMDRGHGERRLRRVPRRKRLLRCAIAMRRLHAAIAGMSYSSYKNCGRLLVCSGRTPPYDSTCARLSRAFVGAACNVCVYMWRRTARSG